MKIYAINTPTDIYISEDPSSNYDTKLGQYLFDGKPPDKTAHRNWVKIPYKPVKISHIEKQPNINYRYRLIDESFLSPTVPLEFKREDIATYDSDDYLWTWHDQYKHLQSLYKIIFDTQPDKEIEDEFEWIDLFTLSSEIAEPSKMEYKVQRTQWSHEGTTYIGNESVEHQLLDKIIFPKPILYQKPCKFSSQDTFNIVRQHIKDNINPKIAVITSDYNFCFTVKKRVPLAKPYKYRVDINNPLFSGRKRKPKMVERTQTDIQKECFEMTWSPENYKGYTAIQPFEAETEDALKELIDNYLNDLMNMINEPMKECPTCEGIGYLNGAAII